MSFGSRTGRLATLHGSIITGSVAFTETLTATSYALTAATSPFLQWQTNQFGANAGNPLIAGPDADPEGDGIVNLR